MNEQASAWLTAIDGLPDVHARLQRVVILNDDACRVIRQQDGPNTLFYCDPPYLQTTRAVRDAYSHEMTRSQHRELLGTLRECQGKVMISGYPSRLYDKVMLPDWNRHDFTIDNKARRGGREAVRPGVHLVKLLAGANRSRLRQRSERDSHPAALEIAYAHRRLRSTCAN